MQDRSTYIKAIAGDAVMVDKHEETSVWLTISTRRGHLATVLTREQAQELIAALALQQVTA